MSWTRPSCCGPTTLVGFLDHRPVFKGHVLLSPVRHVDTLLDLPAELMTPLLAAAQRVAAALGATLGCQGTFVAMNNVVSQSVPHLHVHVVPRTKGDGLKGFFWPGRADPVRRRRDGRRTRTGSGRPWRAEEASDG